MGEGAFIDVLEFKRLMKDADALRRAHSVSQSAAATGEELLRLYEQAMALYAGDFLPEHDSETWAVDQRETLRECALQTLLVMSELYTKLGQPDDALSAAKQTLLHDALFEKGYDAALRLYAASGKQAEAKKLFRKCQETFQAQLGCPPPKPLLALARAVGAIE